MPGSEDISVGQVLLSEYERLKEEQKNRIGFRDNLIYATLGSLALVVAAALQQKGRSDLLLMLPPVAFVLGWTYLVNDEKITSIGRYIRAELGPRLGVVTNAEAGLLQWEHAHRGDGRRKSRKYFQLAVDLTTFCMPAVAAVIVFYINGPVSPALLWISIVELLSITGLGLQIIRYAEFKAS